MKDRGKQATTKTYASEGYLTDSRVGITAYTLVPWQYREQYHPLHGMLKKAPREKRRGGGGGGGGAIVAQGPGYTTVQ